MQIGDLSQIKLQMMQMNKALLEKLLVGSEIEGQLMTKDGQLLLDTKAGIKLPISLCQGDAQLGELLKFVVMSKGDQGIVLQVIPAEQVEQVAKEPKELAQKVMEDLNLPKGETTKSLIEGFVEKQLPLDRGELLKSFYIHKQIKLPVPVIINLLETQGGLQERELRDFQVLRDLGGKTAFLSQLTQVIATADLPKETYRQLSVLLGGQVTRGEAANAITPLQFEPQEMMTPLAQNKWLAVEIEKKVMTFYETLKELPEAERGKYLKEAVPLQEVISKILETLEEVPLPKETRQVLETLKESTAQFHHMQHQGQMFCMPFHYKEQNKDVEVYLFKPKKKHPKAQKELYVVIALDMPALEHLEVHIHQIEKELVIGMEVSNMQVQKHFSRYMEQLSGVLGEVGYTVKQMKVSIKVESPEASQVHALGTVHTPHSMDCRV
ncbi:MAG: hypothetical protein ACRCW2_13985 [Cellulosilyticaceae bacterium]